MNTLIELALLLGGLGILLAMIRLLKGPDVASRAVALDTLTLITMPMMAALALYMDRVIYLDVALVYGILSFLAVVVLARYMDRGV